MQRTVASPPRFTLVSVSVTTFALALPSPVAVASASVMELACSPLHYFVLAFPCKLKS
jgi:hypothetical protein